MDGICWEMLVIEKVEGWWMSDGRFDEFCKDEFCVFIW